MLSLLPRARCTTSGRLRSSRWRGTRPTPSQKLSSSPLMALVVVVALRGRLLPVPLVRLYLVMMLQVLLLSAMAQHLEADRALNTRWLSSRAASAAWRT